MQALLFSEACDSPAEDFSLALSASLKKTPVTAKSS